MLEILPIPGQPQRFGLSTRRLLPLVVKVLTHRSQPLQGRVVRDPVLY